MLLHLPHSALRLACANNLCPRLVVEFSQENFSRRIEGGKWYFCVSYLSLQHPLGSHPPLPLPVGYSTPVSLTPLLFLALGNPIIPCLCSLLLSRFNRVRLWDPMECSLPGCSVHGILQARILKWVAISFCRGFSQPWGSNPHLLRLLHWQADSLPLNHLGSHWII